MAKASAAPATKKDVSLLMERIGDLEQNFHTLRSDMKEWKEEIVDDMKTWKTEVIHEFHIVAEDIRHDAFGIQKDRIADHEHRLTRLERRMGAKA